jgi:hypothetical protein
MTFVKSFTDTVGMGIRTFVGVCVLLISLTAAAHSPEAAREVVVQIDGDGIVAVWSVLPGDGPRDQIWRALVDQQSRAATRDGDHTLAAQLGLTAANDLEIALDGKVVTARLVNARLTSGHHGLGTETMVEYADSKSLVFGPNTNEHVLTMGNRGRGGAMTVHVQALSKAILSATLGSRAVPMTDDGRSMVRPILLKAGSQVRVVMRPDTQKTPKQEVIVDDGVSTNGVRRPNGSSGAVGRN